MFANLEVWIDTKMYSGSVDVWVIEHHSTTNEYISIAENGLLDKTSVPHNQMPSSDLKPFLSIPIALSNALFKAMAEHLESKGIKTKDANLIEGKLLATEKHLEDMREFSKKLLEVVAK